MNANALLSTMDEELAVKALAALAQSSRLRVFRAIVGAGLEGMQPGQLSQTLDIPANTLSFHLKELHHAGLVSVQREGRFLRYCADMSAMQSLVGFLTDHCCQVCPVPRCVWQLVDSAAAEHRTQCCKDPWCLRPLAAWVSISAALSSSRHTFVT